MISFITNIFYNLIWLKFLYHHSKEREDVYLLISTELMLIMCPFWDKISLSALSAESFVIQLVL